MPRQKRTIFYLDIPLERRTFLSKFGMSLPSHLERLASSYFSSYCNFLFFIFLHTFEKNAITCAFFSWNSSYNPACICDKVYTMIVSHYICINLAWNYVVNTIEGRYGNNFKITLETLNVYDHCNIWFIYRCFIWQAHLHVILRANKLRLICMVKDECCTIL